MRLKYRWVADSHCAIVARGRPVFQTLCVVNSARHEGPRFVKKPRGDQGAIAGGHIRKEILTKAKCGVSPESFPGRSARRVG
jgi:hypothetical protein